MKAKLDFMMEEIKYPELKINFEEIKNPFKCPKCDSLAFIQFSEFTPLEIYSKCSCGEEFTSRIGDILGFTPYEKKALDLILSKKKTLQVKKNILEFLGQVNNYSFKCSMEWTKIISDGNELLKVFNINNNSLCQKHLMPNQKNYCANCETLLCHECEREHKDHEFQTSKSVLTEEHYKNSLKEIETGIMKSYDFGPGGFLEQKIKTDFELFSKENGFDDECNKEYGKFLEYILNQGITTNLIVTFIRIILKLFEINYNENWENYVITHNFLSTTNVDSNFNENFYDEKADFKGEDFTFLSKLKNANRIILTKNIFGFYDPLKSQKFLEERKREKPKELSKLASKVEITVNKSNRPKVTSLIYLGGNIDYLFLIGCNDGIIRGFNSEYSCKLTINECKSSVNDLLFINMNEFVSCNDEGTITYYDLSRDSKMKIISKIFKAKYKEIKIFKEHKGKVLRLFKIVENSSGQNKGNFICSVSSDHSIKFWSLNPNQPVTSKITFYDSSINFISAIQYNQYIITTSEDEKLRFWEVKNQKNIESKTVNEVECFGPKSLHNFNYDIFLIGGKNSITVFNALTGVILCSVREEGVGSVSCFLTLNSVSALVNCGGHFWKLSKTVESYIIELVRNRVHNDLITDIVNCDEHNTFMTCSYDSTVKLWKY